MLIRDSFLLRSILHGFTAPSAPSLSSSSSSSSPLPSHQRGHTARDVDGQMSNYADQGQGQGRSSRCLEAYASEDSGAGLAEVTAATGAEKGYDGTVAATGYARTNLSREYIRSSSDSSSSSSSSSSTMRSKGGRRALDYVPG